MRRTRKNPFTKALKTHIGSGYISFCQGIVHKIIVTSDKITLSTYDRDHIQSYGGSALSKTIGGSEQTCENVLGNMLAVLRCVNQVFNEPGYPKLKGSNQLGHRMVSKIVFDLDPESLMSSDRAEVPKIEIESRTARFEEDDEEIVSHHLKLTYNLITANDVRNGTQIKKTVRDIVEAILIELGEDIRSFKVPSSVKKAVKENNLAIKKIPPRHIIDPEVIEEEAATTESSPTTEIDSGWKSNWTEAVVETFDEDADAAVVEALEQTKDLSEHISAGKITEDDAQEEALDIQITAEAAKDTAQAYDQLGLFDNTDDEDAPQEVIEAANEVLEAIQSLRQAQRDQTEQTRYYFEQFGTQKSKPKFEPKPKPKPEPILQTESYFEDILSEGISAEDLEAFCSGVVHRISVSPYSVSFFKRTKLYIKKYGGSRLAKTFANPKVCEATLNNMWIVLKCVTQVFRQKGYPKLGGLTKEGHTKLVNIDYNLNAPFSGDYPKSNVAVKRKLSTDEARNKQYEHLDIAYYLTTANDVRNETQITKTVRDIVEAILENYGADVRGLKVPTTVKTIVNSFAPDIRSVSAEGILNLDLIEEEAAITESSPTTEIDSRWTPSWTEAVVGTFDEDADAAVVEALEQTKDLSEHVSAGDITQEEAQEEALDIQITAEAAKDTAQAYEQLGLFDNTDDENAPQEVIEAADEVLEATKTILITTRGQKSKLLGSDKSIKVTKKPKPKPKPKPEPKPKSEPKPKPKPTLQTVSFDQSMFGELSGISPAPTGSFGSTVKKLHSALAKYLTWEDVRASVKFTFKEGTRDSVSVNSKSAIITLSSSATAKSALPLLAEAMERLYEANDFEFEDTQVNIEYLLGTYMN